MKKLIDLPKTRNIDDIKDFFFKKKGWVYIAQNPMHNYFKIGRTSKNPIDREKSLSNTSVPDNYSIIFALEFFDSYDSEKKVFKALNKFRYNKEFFSVSQNKAVEEISKIFNEERNFIKENIDIDPNDFIEDLDLLKNENLKILKDDYAKQEKRVRNK